MSFLKNMAGGKRHDVDMTQGSAFRHLLSFAFPLMIGNLFQQLYNMVDAWVVGNYVGNEAFSAVGSVAPIINSLIGLFSGLASGAGVVISQYYGAGRKKEVRSAVHTAVMLTLVLSVAFTVIGVLMTPATLRMMNTPDEVFPESRAYLLIYFGGISTLMFYNMFAGIMRAVGDSLRPFYFLVISSLVNTVLDLLFVIVFRMGVRGVAYATVAAQGISALLALRALMTTRSCVRFIPRRTRFHMEMLKKTIRVGIPAGLQMAVTAFSNIFVQSYINAFGADCMGGWTAYGKIDMLVLLPVTSISLASTTHVGQNLGKGQVRNAKHGIRVAFAMSLVSTAVLSAVVMIAAPSLVSFFNDKPEVVEYGTLFLRYVTPFYLITCFNVIYAGALRGAGNSRAPMIIMLLSFVVFRQIYLYVMANYISNQLLPIVMGYPAGWLVASVSTLIYYRRVDLNKNSLVDDARAAR